MPKKISGGGLPLIKPYKPTAADFDLWFSSLYDDFTRHMKAMPKGITDSKKYALDYIAKLVGNDQGLTHLNGNSKQIKQLMNCFYEYFKTAAFRAGVKENSPLADKQRYDYLRGAVRRTFKKIVGTDKRIIERSGLHYSLEAGKQIRNVRAAIKEAQVLIEASEGMLVTTAKNIFRGAKRVGGKALKRIITRGH